MARNSKAARAPTSLLSVALCPHSWDLKHWPEHVYPHTRGRARYLVRMHKLELIAAGALARVGREFVFPGAQYTRWLQREATRALHMDVEPNRSGGNRL